jgi:hypothetical protein
MTRALSCPEDEAEDQSTKITDNWGIHKSVALMNRLIRLLIIPRFVPWLRGLQASSNRTFHATSTIADTLI